MKKTLVIIVAALQMLNAVSAELYSFVPANRIMALHLNLKKVMQTPLYLEWSKRPEFVEQQAKLELELTRNTMSMADLPTELLLFAQPNRAVVMLVKTPVNEAGFKTRLNDCFKNNYQLKYRQTTIAGHLVYLLDNPRNPSQTPEAANIPESIAITYLDNDVALITDEKYAESVLNNLCKSTTAENNPELVKLEFSKPSDAELNAPGAPGFSTAKLPFDRMTIIGEAIPGGKDLFITIDLFCKDASAAEMLSMQLQGIILFGLPNLFNRDPALGMDLSKSLQFSLQDARVTAKLILTGEMQQKLADYAAANSHNNEKRLGKTDKSGGKK